MFKNSMLFIGLDLGDRHSHLVSLDQDGELVEEARLPTTQASLARKFSGIPACRVAIEVGAHSRWVSALLTRLGHEVLVADARKLRLIYHNPRKHDRADAEYLARLARLDPKLLSPSTTAALRPRPIWRSSALATAWFGLAPNSSTTPAGWSRPLALACPPAPPPAFTTRQPPPSRRNSCLPSLRSWPPSLPLPKASKPMTGRSNRWL